MYTESIITITLSVAAIVISVISLIISIKKQSMDKTEFNQRQEERRRAKFRISSHHLPPGKHEICITNIGQSDARNIDCGFDVTKTCVYFLDGTEQFPCPILKSGETLKLIAYCKTEGVNHLSFPIEWSDDFASDNKDELTIFLM